MSSKRCLVKRLCISLYAGLLWMSSGPVQAWWPDGHSTLSKAAVQALPTEMPAFFRAGAGMIAHTTQDPDVSKIAMHLLSVTARLPNITLTLSCCKVGLCRQRAMDFSNCALN
jgi:hypothetical protein